MSFLNGLNVRQKVAATGLCAAALLGVGSVGSTYLQRTRSSVAHKTGGGSANPASSSVGKTSTSKPVKARPAFASVDINAATETELDVLPGVGPATARKIVEYRTSSGGFKSIDELENVKGIGPKKLEQIRPYCRL